MAVGLLFLMTFKEIIKNSGLPWLRLDLEFPYEEMLKEAKALKDYFVAHRNNDEYRHEGWKSLCIHGISAKHTNHYTSYGYTCNEQTPYKWTEIAEQCPTTVKFLKETYPCDTYYRVRFMLLEPTGFISPHTDMSKHRLSPVNLALNHPEGCMMKMKEYGLIPFVPGSAFILDVANEHAYINTSNEDRFHIIIHGNYKSNKQWTELIERSYETYGKK